MIGTEEDRYVLDRPTSRGRLPVARIVCGVVMVKRLFDMVLALLGLVILSPLLAVLAAGVRWSSPGPALFRHVRVGRGSRDFVLYKFRTMTVREGTELGSFDTGDASRVTRLGRFLRATKFDELPQLWNVVLGDMSLVGPRPEVRTWVEAYPERWAVVHTVRPGITDPASIVYRHEEEILAASADPLAEYRDRILPDKLTLYERYIQENSLVGDLGILARTLAALVTST
jgi:lipopolysaccharide/colanic/teichoic acid biosynthesis glycosyltransferase